MIRKLFKRLGVFSLFSFILFFVAAIIISYFSSTITRQVDVHEHTATTASSESTQSIKIMTLNIAHGRGDTFSQWFLSKNQIKTNLNKLADFFHNHKADVVALQEADVNSMWNGSFNHVHYLANAARYRYSAQGAHVKGFNVNYGTALLSRHAMTQATAYSFEPSPPTFAKGFTVGTIHWPLKSTSSTSVVKTPVDVISIHLDFSRQYVREAQIKELIEFIRKRRRPTIVMGDFNSDWSATQTIPQLKKELNFSTYALNKKGMVTFPGRGTRLDWVFVSPELEIVKHDIVRTRLSDHYAVTAQVRMRSNVQVTQK
jgi:endonuclease/exonuclease/phosphatase family metal-dependent hydrolase